MDEPTRQLYPGLSPFRRAADFLTTHGALLICALFLLVGAAGAGDYGIATDEVPQRQIAIINLDYALGKADLGELPSHPDPIYGVSFELPLLLAERVLGLTDYYHIHRLRLTLTHLFFIAGGFCCYLLVYRLFNNRLLALAALLLFLLHPRIYAHSFFNSKDPPFLSMFTIALYLLERAWRRDTVGAFVLLGVAVGILTNLRIMGVMLLPAVLALRGIDLLGAGARGRRKQILVTAGAFALVAGLTPLALSPYAWSQPLDYLTSALNLTVNHPVVAAQLFQGESILSTETPPHYALTWFAITTPPPILLLGLVGIAAVVGQCLAQCRAIADRNRHSRPAYRHSHESGNPESRPFWIPVFTGMTVSELASIGNARLRFGVLLLACFILPLLAVILRESDLYDGWRHLYFIYAPFCLLAVWGWHWLAAAWRGQTRLRWARYGLAGVGLTLIALQMAQLHPYQQIYFNFLVDRTTPEYLRSRYPLDYWRLSLQEGINYLLKHHSGETLNVRVYHRAAATIPEGAREHLRVNQEMQEADYQLIAHFNHRAHQPDTVFNSIYARRIYNNSVLSIKAMEGSRMDGAARNAYNELYRQAVVGEPVGQSDYDVYLDGRLVTFVREDCRAGERAAAFGVKVYRADSEGPPGRIPDTGSYELLTNLGVRLDGRCLAVIRLPDYPVAYIRAGQYYGGGFPVWEVGHSLESPGLAEQVAAMLKNSPRLAAGGAFDLYRQGRRLIYYREVCAVADTEPWFFLHIIPTDADSLAAERRRYGFENRDFDFAVRGVHFEGKCLAAISLPEYAIAEIRTGQYTAEQGELWAAESRLWE